MKYLLDTDHLSIWQRRLGKEYEAIERHFALCGDTDVGLCVVSFHEQALAAHTYLSRSRDPARIVRGYHMFARIVESFSGITLALFDEQALAIFEELRAKPVRISTMDLRIAAIAIANDVTLVTRNRSDFSQVPGLSVEDWTT